MLESPPIDTQLLWDIFTLYGPSARHCYQLAKTPGLLRTWELAITPTFQGVPDPVRFARLVPGSSDCKDESVLDVLSQLITIIPGKHRQPEVAIVSPHVAKHLFSAVLDFNATTFWNYFNLFWQVPATHSSAGWIWQPHVIQELSGGSIRTVTPKILSNPAHHSQKKPRVELVTLTLPFPRPIQYDDQQSLSQALANFFTSGQEIGFFVPAANNQATFDAFLILSGGTIILFQATCERSHDIKDAGLDFLWDALRQAKNLLSAQSSARVDRFFPQPRAGGRKWQLIFAVPQRVATFWTTPQPVVLAKRKRSWELYIEQFVLVLSEGK
jgi:hypothetical protein